MRPRYYRLVGHNVVPCGLWGWVVAVEACPTRVGHTRIGPFRVSTVFLGLDHQFGDGPPLLFETMTFLVGASAGIGFDGVVGCNGRWSTWDEAEQAHGEAVQYLRDNYCHEGEQSEEIEEPRGACNPRCPKCSRMFEQGPYFERRVKRHLMRHQPA